MSAIHSGLDNCSIWLAAVDRESIRAQNPHMTKSRLAQIYCLGVCLSLTPLISLAYSDQVAIQFSHPGGLLRDGQAVSLKLAAEPGDVEIYYTLDGSPATNDGKRILYEAPIPIRQTTLVRAVAFNGESVVARDSRAYLFTNPALTEFDSNLPLVVIEAFGTDIDSEAQWNSRAVRRPVHVVLFDKDKRTQRASIGNSPVFNGRAGMRVRGQTSSQFDKKQYSLELWNEQDEDRDASLLGMPPESDWVLYAPWLDKTLMRNVLAYRWFREMGHYSVRSRFVEVFHNAEGGAIGMDDYRGVYVLMEKIKRDRNRVDIAKLDAAISQVPEVTGGYIFRVDKGTQRDANFDAGLQNIGFVEPKKPNAAQYNYLRRHVNELVNTLASDEFSDPKAGYASYIDVPTFIDVHIHVELLKNVDGFRFSTFMWKDRGKKIRLGPVWDYNLSLGNASSHEGDTPEGWYYNTIDDYEYLYFERLFEDPNFELQYWDRYFELRREVFATDKLMRQIDELEKMLEESQERNFERWPIFNRRLFRHPATVVARKTHREQVQWMKEWLEGRLNWMDQQFTPPPIIQAAAESVASGTQLKIILPEGLAPGSCEIFYTTDGSDPRRSDGQPSPHARIFRFDSNVAVKNNMSVNARVRDYGRWGALAVQGYRLERRAGGSDD